MIKVTRKQGESFDGLFRRFKRRIQVSGIDKEVRRRKFRDAVPNRNATRRSKVRGLKIADRMHWMIRSGRATEEDFRPKRRRRS